MPKRRMQQLIIDTIETITTAVTTDSNALSVSNESTNMIKHKCINIYSYTYLLLFVKGEIVVKLLFMMEEIVVVVFVLLQHQH